MLIAGYCDVCHCEQSRGPVQHRGFVASEAIEEFVDWGVEDLQPVVTACDRCRVVVAADGDADDLGEQLWLRREREVDGLIGDVRVLGDRDNARLRVAVAEEQRVRAGTDPLAGRAGSSRASRRVVAPRS